MKRSEYRGFTQVFRFTFLQAIFSKSLIITTAVMMLIALVAFPVISLFNKEDDNYQSPIKKVYVINETGMQNIPYADAFKDKDGYADVAFEETDKELDVLAEEISKEHAEEVVLKFELDQGSGGYMLNFYRDAESPIDDGDVDKIASEMAEWFDKYKVTVLDADADTLEMIGKVVDFSVMDSGEFLETDTHEVISYMDYNVVYAFLMVCYMVIILASNMVAAKVVEEKANRVVEYLMTAVRPMALILGKVVAMLSVCILEITLIAASGIISSKLTSALNGSDGAGLLSGFLSSDAIKNISIPNFLICIVMIALGVLIYGLLAGLFGASVSKMEDLQQGLKVYTAIILVAFFACITACEMMWTVGINGFVSVMMFIPFTSVMILPGAILIGKASVAVLAVSLVLQAVTAAVILKIVSLVYESIIVMNGNPVSVKQMVALIRRK